jgi:uncharacterized protein YndB with AHSA1/START domain
MQVRFESEHPVTDAACRQATGKPLQTWFAALEEEGGSKLKRRDAINWLFEQTGKDMWWSTTIWVEYERSRGIVNKKDGLIEGYNICVTKTISAPLNVVYSAFAQEASLGKWFGSHAKATVVDAGTFSDGSGNHGTYLRVRADKDLRFTWKNRESVSETLVDVMFAAKGKDKTGITLNHCRIQNREEADGLRAAWGMALNQLKDVLE